MPQQQHYMANPYYQQYQYPMYSYPQPTYNVPGKFNGGYMYPAQTPAAPAAKGPQVSVSCFPSGCCRILCLSRF